MHVSRLGLTISPSKKEIVVFNGAPLGAWHGGHELPQPASIKHLTLVFHESGDMSPGLGNLEQHGTGAAAHWNAKIWHEALLWSKSFPIMVCLIDAIARPMIIVMIVAWPSSQS